MRTIGSRAGFAPVHLSMMPYVSTSVSSRFSNTSGYSSRMRGTNRSNGSWSVSGFSAPHTVGMRSISRNRSTAASSPAAELCGSGSLTGVGLSRTAFTTSTTTSTTMIAPIPTSTAIPSPFRCRSLQPQATMIRTCSRLPRCIAVRRGGRGTLAVQRVIIDLFSSSSGG